ncbi:hypothetical protein M885DRAFT_612053 [Pelagophyceae sp. CCMP2097]|nr:hypothetical protein M885DRAFT_612053 [Pelagophyceae sp. CCMP2097]
MGGHGVLERLPAALVSEIVGRWLPAECWGALLTAARAFRGDVRQAVQAHAWRARVEELDALLRRGAPAAAQKRRLSTIARLLWHVEACGAQIDRDGDGAQCGSGVAVAKIPRLVLQKPLRLGRDGAAPGEADVEVSAEDVLLRCPDAAWRPWLPLTLKFDGATKVHCTRRNIAPIPPVCEVFAQTEAARAALRKLAHHLYSRGEVGRIETPRAPGAGRDAARCTVYLVPRRRAVDWLASFDAVEKLYGVPPSAGQRRGKLPPHDGRRGEDDLGLWAVVVPPSQQDDAPADAGDLDHILELTRSALRAQ